MADDLNKGGRGVWLGRNNLGWVFLDRTLSCNQPSGTEYLFVRASDWTTFWSDAASWKDGGTFAYYAMYLSSLRDDAKVTAIAAVEALCAEYLARAPDLRHKMQQLINEKRRKQREDFAALKAEQEERARIFLEERRADAEIADKLRHEKRIERLKSLMLEAQQRDCAKIKTFVRERGVRHLFHFTRITNLNGIAAHGVLPRFEIPDGFSANDAYRFDGYREAICLSAGYINYKMFWYCYYQNQDVPNWALVAISPEILQDTPCLFFSTNAANGRFRNLSDEALASHMGFNGISNMYFDEPAGLRAERNLKGYWTTDPQAEILAFGRIPANRVEVVALLRPDHHIEQKLRSLQPGWRVDTNPGLFEKRHDYKLWQGGEAVRLSDDTSSFDDIPF